VLLGTRDIRINIKKKKTKNKQKQNKKTKAKQEGFKAGTDICLIL